MIRGLTWRDGSEKLTIIGPIFREVMIGWEWKVAQNSQGLVEFTFSVTIMTFWMTGGNVLSGKICEDLFEMHPGRCRKDKCYCLSVRLFMIKLKQKEANIYLGTNRWWTLCLSVLIRSNLISPSSFWELLFSEALLCIANQWKVMDSNRTFNGGAYF